MKKLLSMLGAFVLSASLLVGCGPDTQALEDATKEMTTITQGLASYQDKMDDETLTKFMELSQEMSNLGQDMIDHADEYTDQGTIDETVSKMNEITNGLKEIADKVGYKYE